VFASLTAGGFGITLAVTTAWYTWSLNETNIEAQREALVASQTRDLILELMKAGDPLVAQGKDTTVIEVIDAGLASIREADIDDPEARVELMHTLADVYHNLGAVRKASDLLSEAHAYSQRTLGRDHELTWSSAGLLASILMTTGNYAEAKTYYDEQQAALDRASIEGPRRAELMNGKALLYLRTGRYEEAMELGERSLAYARETLGEHSKPALTAINSLSEIFRMSAQPDASIELLTAHLPVAAETLGELHPVTIEMALNLAGTYYVRYGLERAAPLLEEVRTKNLEVFGPNHPNTIRDTIYLGALYGDAGRFDEAAELIEEGIARHVRLFGMEHPNSIRFRASQMHLYLQQGQLEAALEMCAELVPLHLKVNGEDHWFTLETRTSCATTRYEAGQRERGAQELRSVLADLRRVFGNDFLYALGTTAYMARHGIPEKAPGLE
jgi:tetratricopeptide (TPR) repeat protein